jgi:glycosyltransferase involved in cell wall biosynthesis
MPSYNGKAHLSAAINSVLAQKEKNWRLFISDDGSVDGTRQYLSSIEDPRVDVYFQEKNLGIFGNLNFLVSKVQTPFTYILCQDDYFVDDGALGRVLGEWAKYPSEAAFIRFNHTTDSHSALERYEKSVLPSLVRADVSDLYFFVFGCVPGNLSNVCMRTDVAQQFGWFDQGLPYAGDFEFWARVGRKRPWGITTTKVVEVRRHEGQASVSLNRKGELLPQLDQILETLYQKLASQGYPQIHLKVFATLCYVSMHRYIGVRQIMKTGAKQYLMTVGNELGKGSYSLPAPFAWLLFLISGGGRYFRVMAAKWILGLKRA